MLCGAVMASIAIVSARPTTTKNQKSGPIHLGTSLTLLDLGIRRLMIALRICMLFEKACMTTRDHLMGSLTILPSQGLGLFPLKIFIDGKKVCDRPRYF
jgi:hypothetical protein